MDHIWFTPRLAFVDNASFLPKVAHIWLELFGPYLLFTTWATLGSHSDYTLPSTLHLCLQRPTCDLIHLGHFCCFTYGPVQVYIHFGWAIRRPAEPYHCLKWPTSTCYLGYDSASLTADKPLCFPSVSHVLSLRWTDLFGKFNSFR